MSEELFDIDLAYGCDDEMQQDIEKMKADPLALLPDKSGFLPSALVAAPKEGSDERSVWYQTETCEIADSSISPLNNRDTGEMEGQVVRVTHKVASGTNEGKRLEQTWWVRLAERETIQQMNADLADLFNQLNVKPVVKKNSEGNSVTSYLGSLERLDGKMTKVRVSQKWGHPWKKVGGDWVELSDEPMKFKKRIVSVYKA